MLGSSFILESRITTLTLKLNLYVLFSYLILSYLIGRQHGAPEQDAQQV